MCDNNCNNEKSNERYTHEMLNCGCLPNPYCSWKKFPEKRTEVNEIMRTGPLCYSNYCPRPISFDDVNYRQNMQRSPFDNRFGCNAYNNRAQNMIKPGEYTYF